MIRPLGDVLVVRPDPDPLQSPGGLYLVGDPLERSGVVVACGPGRWRVRDSSEEKLSYIWVPMDVQVGQRVVWRSALGATKAARAVDWWFDQAQENLVLIRQGDVLYERKEGPCN